MDRVKKTETKSILVSPKAFYLTRYVIWRSQPPCNSDYGLVGVISKKENFLMLNFIAVSDPVGLKCATMHGLAQKEIIKTFTVIAFLN